MQPGAYLKILRIDCGISLEDLALKSGYSRRYLREIEAGTKTPELFALRCIATAITEEGRKRIMRKFLGEEAS